MHPDFLSIGPLMIHSYGVMMALGFLAGLGNWILLGRREGHSPQFCTDLMFWVIVSGIVGARTAYVLENWTVYAADPISVIRVDQGGPHFLWRVHSSRCRRGHFWPAKPDTAGHPF